MNIIEDRITVERLLASLEQRDPQTRQKVHQALLDARRAGGKQMWLLLAAAAVAAGGALELPAAVIRTRSEDLGFTIEENWETGDITVRIGGFDPAVVAGLRAAGVLQPGQPVELPPPPDDLRHQTLPVAPADPSEPDDRAARRMCQAVKMFLLQHYAGELQTRGRAFTTSVMATLHAEAIGVSLAKDDVVETPEEFEARLDAALATLPKALKPMATLAHEVTQRAAEFAAIPGTTVSLH